MKSTEDMIREAQRRIPKSVSEMARDAIGASAHDEVIRFARQRDLVEGNAVGGAAWQAAMRSTIGAPALDEIDRIASRQGLLDGSSGRQAIAEHMKMLAEPSDSQVQWVMPDIQPPLHFKTMSEVMDEQDEKLEARHREQLAEVRRLAAAAETSAKAALDSDRSAKESLMWGRAAALLALAALAVTAWAYLFPVQ